MTRVVVRESVATAAHAKEVLITCEVCSKSGVVTFVTYGTPQERQALIREFCEEHRRIGCPAGETQQKRKFRISYPRV